MAFLCPSRVGKEVKERKKQGKATVGRITGSDSVDTLVRVGLEKQHGLPADCKLLVLKDFNPLSDDELHVRRGQHVYLLYREEEWCYVINAHGQEGFVPDSFCVNVKNKSKASAPKGRHRRSSGGSSESNLIDDSFESNNTDLTEEEGLTETRAPEPYFSNNQQVFTSVYTDVRPFRKTSHGQYIALFNFRGTEENDVNSVERAELFEVLNIEDPDWSWIRKYDGQEGFVPKSFICPVEPLKMQERLQASIRPRPHHGAPQIRQPLQPFLSHEPGLRPFQHSTPQPTPKFPLRPSSLSVAKCYNSETNVADWRKEKSALRVRDCSHKERLERNTRSRSNSPATTDRMHLKVRSTSPHNSRSSSPATSDRNKLKVRSSSPHQNTSKQNSRSSTPSIISQPASRSVTPSFATFSDFGQQNSRSSTPSVVVSKANSRSATPTFANLGQHFSRSSIPSLDFSQPTVTSAVSSFVTFSGGGQSNSRSSTPSIGHHGPQTTLRSSTPSVVSMELMNEHAPSEPPELTTVTSSSTILAQDEHRDASSTLSTNLMSTFSKTMTELQTINKTSTSFPVVPSAINNRSRKGSNSEPHTDLDLQEATQAPLLSQRTETAEYAQPHPIQSNPQTDYCQSTELLRESTAPNQDASMLDTRRPPSYEYALIRNNIPPRNFAKIEQAPGIYNKMTTPFRDRSAIAAEHTGVRIPEPPLKTEIPTEYSYDNRRNADDKGDNIHDQPKYGPSSDFVHNQYHTTQNVHQYSSYNDSHTEETRSDSQPVDTAYRSDHGNGQSSDGHFRYNQEEFWSFKGSDDQYYPQSSQLNQIDFVSADGEFQSNYSEDKPQNDDLQVEKEGYQSNMIDNQPVTDHYRSYQQDNNSNQSGHQFHQDNIRYTSPASDTVSNNWYNHLTNRDSQQGYQRSSSMGEFVNRTTHSNTLQTHSSNDAPDTSNHVHSNLTSDEYKRMMKMQGTSTAIMTKFPSVGNLVEKFNAAGTANTNSTLNQMSTFKPLTNAVDNLSAIKPIVPHGGNQSNSRPMASTPSSNQPENTRQNDENDNNQSQYNAFKASLESIIQSRTTVSNFNQSVTSKHSNLKQSDSLKHPEFNNTDTSNMSNASYGISEMVMMYDYTSQNTDRLTLKRGDVVYVDNPEQQDPYWLWIYSPVAEKYGYVPKDYVKSTKLKTTL